MPSEHEIELLRTARHGDPFSVLGPHRDEHGAWRLRVLLPGARHVEAIDALTGRSLIELFQRHPDGYFVGALSDAGGPDDASAYRLQVV